MKEPIRKQRQTKICPMIFDYKEKIVQKGIYKIGIKIFRATIFQFYRIVKNLLECWITVENKFLVTVCVHSASTQYVEKIFDNLCEKLEGCDKFRNYLYSQNIKRRYLKFGFLANSKTKQNKQNK